MYVCQVDEIKRSTVWLKPRQDLNILATPPLPLPTLSFCTFFLFKLHPQPEKTNNKKNKHLTCVCLTAYSSYLSLLFLPYSLLVIHRFPTLCLVVWSQPLMLLFLVFSPPRKTQVSHIISLNDPVLFYLHHHSQKPYWKAKRLCAPFTLPQLCAILLLILKHTECKCVASAGVVTSAVSDN